MIPELLERAGTLWGNQEEYLACEKDCKRYQWTENTPRRCEVCKDELCVVSPNGQTLSIRYLCWKYDQKWWPQRFIRLPGNGDDDYEYIKFLGREWRKRPSRWTL